ncbi:Similar to S.cerevisiae protein REV1 (Deoxycytidyl transferase) [Malassezia sympodialis ATCC 42132]|uniref:Similar to S.cerevisiae protein REV1 (Deoxycytidyl transferase) n=1 Tax=Malassezia sympodialis (strain ATCC 42132) TaxID=1230383 RepID=A0A1M8AC13_MALS4|nr:Similar to S.cerevisiae protein REV1 (Deoxycytidyl transferase) [Malassezia sympodialis ATCC 42132]
MGAGSTPSSSFPCSDEDVLLEALRGVEGESEFAVYEDPAPNPARRPATPPPRAPLTERRDLMEAVSPPASPSPDTSYLAGKAYQALSFGDWGAYMRHKRAKLRVQDAELAASAPASRALAGCVLYVNGRTDPPYAELRRLVLAHGGQCLPYLDRKRDCTHIVASTLPPKKRAEFRHYRVVRPAWVLESCRLGRPADWTQFRIDGMDQGATLTAHWAPAAPAADEAEDLAAPHARAARLLASEAWRASHTAASPHFLRGYYEHSRLHHLSTWKANLQELVAHASSETGACAPLLPASVPRTLMHVDFDSFFVSVGLRDRPALRGQPVAVCHATGPPSAVPSTAEIASCNYVARAQGVRNGMSLGHARRCCGALQTIPYTMEAYYTTSLQFYAILLGLADVLQVVSVDEALIDVSALLHRLETAWADDTRAHPTGALHELETHFRARRAGTDVPAAALAEAIRTLIRTATQCEASIGVGANVLQARLATRRAKPSGSFVLQGPDVLPLLRALDVGDVWGVGARLQARFAAWLGTTNVGAILDTSSEQAFVQQWGPKHGARLWAQFHGRDTDQLRGTHERQSVGTHVTWGVRLSSEAELRTFVDGLCDEVAQRQARLGVVGTHVSVQVLQRDASRGEAPKFLGHGPCIAHNRSVRHRIPDAATLRRCVWTMVQAIGLAPVDVRGISMSVSKWERTGSTLEAWWARRAPAADGGGARPEPGAAPDAPVLPAPDDASALRNAEPHDAPAVPRAVPDDAPAAPDDAPAAPDDAPAAPHDAPALPSATPVQVPPASQLDPQVLAHLPTPMRAQIEAVLAERRTPALPSSPAPTTPSKRRRSSASPRTPRRASSTSPGRQARLSAYFSPTRRAQSDTLRAAQARGWDVDVFSALPPALQADLLQEPAPREPRPARRASAPARTAAAARRLAAESAVQHEAHIRRAAGAYAADDAVQCAAARPAEEGVQPRASLVEVDARHPLYASWPGASLSPAAPLDALRAQLRAWHGACAHAAPRAGDVALVQRLLDVCVQAQALDKVQGVLGWWRALCADAHPAWRAAWARVHAHVQAHMSAQYGATLAG